MNSEKGDQLSPVEEAYEELRREYQRKADRLESFKSNQFCETQWAHNGCDRCPWDGDCKYQHVSVVQGMKLEEDVKNFVVESVNAQFAPKLQPELQPNALIITNVNKLVLKGDAIDVEFSLDAGFLYGKDKIIINGVTFVREKE